MGYKPHLKPSRTRSWLETPCRKRITVPLIDGVWQLPLWQDTDKPQVIPSPAATGGGVLRAPRTFSATSKRLSFWNLEADDSVELDASHFSGERDTEPCIAGPLLDSCRERTNNTDRSTTGADFSPSGERTNNTDCSATSADFSPSGESDVRSFRKCFKVWNRADLAPNDRIFTS